MTFFHIVRKSFDVHRMLTFSWRTTGDVHYIKSQLDEGEEFESEWGISTCIVKLVYWYSKTDLERVFMIAQLVCIGAGK